MLRFWNSVIRMGDSRITKIVLNGNMVMKKITGVPISVKLFYIDDNFMWCNIELAAKQLQILEKKQWK